MACQAEFENQSVRVHRERSPPRFFPKISRPVCSSMSVSDGLLSGDTFAYLDSLRNVMAKDAEARLQETNRLKSTIAEMEMRCKGLEEQLLVKEGQLKIKDEEYASLAAQVKSLNEAQRATKV